ncbi:CHAP domain-containing protein, partial [Enterococcus faecalis]
FPVKTDALIVNKRYGYDKSKEKLTLYQGIDVLIEDNQPFHSPMNGQIVSVPDTETLVIEKEKVARLTIRGVNTLRLTKGMDVEEGTFLGNTKNSTVTFQYEKYKKETKD